MDMWHVLEFKVTPQSSGSGMTPLMYCVEPVFSVPSTAYVTLICVIDSEGGRRSFESLNDYWVHLSKLLTSRVVILLLYIFAFCEHRSLGPLLVFLAVVWASLSSSQRCWFVRFYPPSGNQCQFHNAQPSSHLKIHFWAPAALSPRFLLCFPMFSLGLRALLGHGCDSGGLLRHNANRV